MLQFVVLVQAFMQWATILSLILVYRKFIVLLSIVNAIVYSIVRGCNGGLGPFVKNPR